MPITKATASSIAPAAKGDLVVGSATNDAAVLGVGSNSQVLTADSSTTTGLKWATASADYVFISRTSFTNVASQAIDSVFTSTYKSYEIIFESFYSTSDNNADAQLQWRYGSTTQTGNYMNAGSMMDSGINFTSLSAYQGGQITLSNNSSTGAGPSHGFMNVFNVGDGSSRPTATWMFNNGETITCGFGGSSCHTANSYTGFLLKASTGNITGTVAVYGRK